MESVIGYSITKITMIKWVTSVPLKIKNLQKNKKPATVASKLLPLFLQQGTPMILQSDNGREFVAKVIEELVKIWKDCKIAHGSPCHPQWQSSVERANADIVTMMTQWMEDEKNENWSWGIQFIAQKKNNRYHEGIKQISYVLRYRQPCRVGQQCTHSSISPAGPFNAASSPSSSHSSSTPSHHHHIFGSEHSFLPHL
jgi:hypothetical protein